jgi:hypothetical protein
MGTVLSSTFLKKKKIFRPKKFAPIPFCEIGAVGCDSVCMAVP